MGLSADIRNHIYDHPGLRFDARYYYQLFGIFDNDKRSNVRQLFKKMVESGELEKERGLYRLVDNSAPEIDWRGAGQDIYDIKLPFNLDKWFSLRPRTCMTVGGDKDAGKTAFLYKVVLMNMHKKDTQLLTNLEGGEGELRERMEGLGIEIPEPPPFKVRERYDNFEDVIKPDGLNVIDYLDEGENAYLVGGKIRKILSKLKNGIAVIGLQKPKGRDLPYGKDYALRYSYAAVALSSTGANGVLKILAAKGRPDKTVNPVGKQWSYTFNGNGNFANIQESWG